MDLSRFSPIGFAAGLVNDILDPNVDLIPNAGLQTVGITGNEDVRRINAANQTQPTQAGTSTGTQDGGSAFDTGDVLGAGTTAAQRAASAEDVQYFNDQIARLEAQKNRANTGLQQGLTGLEDSFNKNVSQVNQNRGRALENFGIQREDTIRGKDRAIDRVDTNARVLSDSLRRRLGMASGSDSSAYQITAPGAVARDASANRTGVVESFGQNFRDLGVAEDRAKTDFEQLLEELAAQRRTAESGLRGGILETQNQIETQLADAARQRALAQGGGYTQARAASRPFETNISQRESAIDNLFNQFRNPYQMREVKVNTPQLRDYTVDRAAINSNQQTGAQDPYAPYRPAQAEEEEQLL